MRASQLVEPPGRARDGAPALGVRRRRVDICASWPATFATRRAATADGVIRSGSGIVIELEDDA